MDRRSPRRILITFPSVTVSCLITAPAEALFDIVSDVTQHPKLAGSGEVRGIEWITPAPHGEGSGFASRQQIGLLRYPARSYVQEYRRPYRFVWLSGFGMKKPPFGQLWGFDFQPLDSRTTWVSNMMRVPAYPVPRIPPLSWLASAGLDHEARNMKPTLRNLAVIAGAQLLGEIKVNHDWCGGAIPCGRATDVLRAV
jgi:hypothetical protein